MSADTSALGTPASRSAASAPASGVPANGVPVDDHLVLALPKGRILKELRPLLTHAGILPEPAFDDDNSRLLRFATNVPNLSIIRVRSFDVATFVAFGAAHLGVAGSVQ